MADSRQQVPFGQTPRQGLLLVSIMLALLMLFLPPPASTLALIGCLGIGLYTLLLRAGYQPRTYPGLLLRLLRLLLGPPFDIAKAFIRVNRGEGVITSDTINQPFPRLFARVNARTRTAALYALEIGIILWITLSATRVYQFQGYQLSGSETEWLTSSAYAAVDGLREYGRIPWWQPYLEFGEPLLDNPFSFVMNPISTGPSLLIGAEEGLKVSVILTTFAAGLGGWLFGWTLGFGFLGRLLLGLLLVGKGNMHGMFNTGYYQLAASQAYFPWIMAGVVGLFRLPDKRWPPVLLGVSAALLLFAGNIWYTLPMAICVALIALFYLIRPRHPKHVLSPLEAGAGIRKRLLFILRKAASPIRRIFDWGGLGRLVLAGAVALSLSAVTLLPMLVNHGQLGKHPPEAEAGWVVPLWDYIIPAYFNPDPRQPLELYHTGWGRWEHWELQQVAEWYYSFVIPLSFVLFITLAIPLYRPRWNRVWIAAVILAVFFTLWGAGGQPLFLWLYRNITVLGEWRFVGRALAVSSFWIAVLVAMRVEGLWTIIRATDWRQVGLPVWMARRFAPVLLSLLTVATLLAAYEVTAQWRTSENSVVTVIHMDDECISWLRERFPDRELTIWRWGYEGITTLMNNRVRTYDVQADFEMSPLPSTIGDTDLTASFPEFALLADDKERRGMWMQGYRPMIGAKSACFYRKANTLPHAYTVTELTLENTRITVADIYTQVFVTLPRSAVNPVTTYQRQPDNILLLVQGNILENTVLTVQERAYPGWRATIDGRPVKLESVGGQIGVMLPRDRAQHVVYFEYRPMLLTLGGWITLATAGITTLYLLRVDRWLKALITRRRTDA